MPELSEPAGLKFDDYSVFLILILQVLGSFLATRFSAQLRVFGPFLPGIYAGVGLLSSAIVFGSAQTFWVVLVVPIQYLASKLCRSPQKTMAASGIAFGFVTCYHLYRFLQNRPPGENCIVNVMMVQMPRTIYFYWHCLGLYSKGESLPSIGSYFLYMFNFIGLLTGPVFTYEEHLRLLANANTHSPDRNKKILQKSLIVLASLVGFLIGLKWDIPSWAVAESMASRSVVYRIGCDAIVSLIFRLRFYIAWCTVEIICSILCLKDSQSNYRDYIETLDVGKIESDWSLKSRVENWNFSISKWLRLCFYQPLIGDFKFSKASASFVCFMLSAFWHGVAPNYYLGFFLLFLISAYEKVLFRKNRLDWLAKTVSHVLTNSAGFVFYLRDNDDWKKYIRISKDVLLFIPVMLALSLLLPKKQPARDAKAAATGELGREKAKTQ